MYHSKKTGRGGVSFSRVDGSLVRADSDAAGRTSIAYVTKPLVIENRASAGTGAISIPADLNQQSEKGVRSDVAALQRRLKELDAQRAAVEAEIAAQTRDPQSDAKATPTETVAKPSSSRK